MTDRVAVYTAIMNCYDELPGHPEIADVDFIAYLDRPLERDDWQVRSIDHVGTEHPRIVAKRYKVLVGEHLADYDYTIWIDGSHEIVSSSFADEVIASIGSSGFALYRHPWRDCIYDEALASIALPKYGGLPIEAQVAAYRELGHPEHDGLWACGTLARTKSPKLDQLMAAWMDEIERWTYQDQLSLPVLLRRFGIAPSEFGHHQVLYNPWLRIRGHPRNDE
ncbi:MAG: putative glycosyltransferase [Acidimicrobiaceae bacterium]|nr:putative glycosyltransferase [Acidimicrobiaceae bacterium]